MEGAKKESLITPAGGVTKKRGGGKSAPPLICFSTCFLLFSPPSGDLDLDLFGLKFLGLGQMHGEDAVFEPGLYLRGVYLVRDLYRP